MTEPDPPSSGRVLLADDLSALQVLHGVLADTVAAFPSAFGSIGLPATAEAFRSVYPDVLPASRSRVGSTPGLAG